PRLLPPGAHAGHHAAQAPRRVGRGGGAARACRVRAARARLPRRVPARLRHAGARELREGAPPREVVVPGGSVLALPLAVRAARVAGGPPLRSRVDGRRVPEHDAPPPPLRYATRRPGPD